MWNSGTPRWKSSELPQTLGVFLEAVDEQPPTRRSEKPSRMKFSILEQCLRAPDHRHASAHAVAVFWDTALALG